MDNFAQHKLITCILPHGTAFNVIEKLKDEKKIYAANINHARGMGRLTPQQYRGAGEQTEKEILNVMAPAARADELFEYIYVAAEINRPHGGIIYMSKLHLGTTFTIPDVPEEERKF